MKKKVKKEQEIAFKVGDLVVPNFDFLGISRYECLFMVMKVEKEQHTEHFWWQKEGEKYVYLTVREIQSEREITSLVVTNKGQSHCEYIVL